MSETCDFCDRGNVAQTGWHYSSVGARSRRDVCLVHPPEDSDPLWLRAEATRRGAASGRRIMRASEWLGVDVGWVFPAADSDGNIYEWTRRRAPREYLATAGPVTIVKPDGTRETRPAYTLRAAAVSLSRGTSEAVGITATKIVSLARRTNRGLALEDWSQFQRRKPAWVKVYDRIARRAQDHRVPITQVNRAYTSITCPRCDWKSRENRVTRDRFECQNCGFAGHADVIAAMNIARRADGTFGMATGVCSSPACGDPAWKAGFCSACYRFRRRTGRGPYREDVEVRLQSVDFKAYRNELRRQAMNERATRRSHESSERMRESYRTHDAWGNPLLDQA